MIYRTGTKVIVNVRGTNKVGIILRKNYHSSLQSYRYKVMLEDEIVHFKVPILPREYKDKPFVYIDKDISDNQSVFKGINTKLSVLQGNIQRNRWNIDYSVQQAANRDLETRE